MARVYGKQVLQESCGTAASAAPIDELVAAVIDILGAVVQFQMNYCSGKRSAGRL
jgi:hypothetical protein